MATQGIWISIDIMHNKELTPNEKFIYSEILQLATLDKGCIASNKHFAELINITTVSVSRCIHKIENLGYINTEIIPGSRNHIRKITLNKMLNPPYQNVKPPLTKCYETKENKTINKTNNYDLFLLAVKKRVKLKSKVTKTKEGEKLFKEIDDKDKLLEDYVAHHEDKKEYAKRLTSFMEDYTIDEEDDWKMKYAN